MEKAIKFLKGKKTYIVAAGVAITVGLFSAGVIERGMAEMLLGLLGAGGVATLGAKINRASKPVE